MPITTIDSTIALTTKEVVKSPFWGMSGTTDDTLLDSLINAVSSSCESRTGRKLKERAYTNELYDIKDDSPVLLLKQMPVSTSATLTVVENTTTLTKGTDFFLYENEGKLLRMVASSKTATKDWLKGFQIVKVSYTAGYTTIPYDLEEAAIKWVIYLYEAYSKKNLHVESASIGDGSSISLDIGIRGIPMEVERVLRRYERLIL